MRLPHLIQKIAQVDPALAMRLAAVIKTAASYTLLPAKFEQYFQEVIDTGRFLKGNGNIVGELIHGESYIDAEDGPWTEYKLYAYPNISWNGKRFEIEYFTQKYSKEDSQPGLWKSLLNKNGWKILSASQGKGWLVEQVAQTKG